MKKVLVIGYVWPEPNSSAAGSHMLSVLRLLKKQNWQIEFATPAQETDHMADLNAEGVRSKNIKLNCNSFDLYITQYQPNIVIFDRFMMEEQFGWRVDKYCPNAVKILDTVDLQCLRVARHMAFKQDRNLTSYDLSSNLAKREIASIMRCDLSLIISPFEISLLTDHYKIDATLLHHLPFMVNLSRLPDKTTSFTERHNFITIGNFRHAPNWDSVIHLQTLWPKIKKQLPDAQCHVYGAYPPPKATALNNEKAGFLIKGWAENSHNVMEQARVCLAPLRFGAGLKGKLLDAMIMQTPSVTTHIGSEGMHAQYPWPGSIAHNSNEFITNAVNLYQNHSTWEVAQSNCHPLLHSLYNSQILGEALISKIANIEQHLSRHRLENFTGAMLKHHTMASTKYMSQWISAKNDLKQES